MRSFGTAANDSLVQKPSRTTRHASHSRTQCGLVPLSERAVPSQLMQSRALRVLSAMEVKVEVEVEVTGATKLGVVGEREVEVATACVG